ncbi:MAG: hypothetical protein Phog2KO_28040 [Phototrophicaceae bacterium]
MFEALEIGSGLDIVLWFQEHRTAWMELMVQILDQMGYDLGYVALFGLIFWAISKRHGIRLVFALIIIGIVSFALKDIMMRPRPYAVSDLVRPVFEADGYGIPSGHTSLAVMIWGYIALWLRKGWVWVLAVAYMLLQGVGRMIAGVHYPQDIVAGFILGVVTLAIYYPSATHWGQFWKKQSFTVQIAIALIIPLIMISTTLFLPLPQEQIEAYLSLIGLVMGVGLGATIEAEFIQFEAHPQASKRAIHFVLGIIIVAGIILGLSPLFDLIAETGILAYILRLIRYGLGGFTAIVFVPLLGIKLNLMLAGEKSKPINATV